MNAHAFELTIATLDKLVFQGKVLSVYFPTPTGEVGVLFNHANYLTDTLAGTLKYTELNGNQQTITLPHAGIFSMENNQGKLWMV